MLKKLLLPLIHLHCIFYYVETQARNVSLSRDHVSVWFESPLHKSVQHEKENLEGMIKLVSGTFGTIITQLDPQIPLLKNQPLITELVAEHNRKKGTKKLKVVISFEGQSSGQLSFYQLQSNVTVLRNLKNAKKAADKANAIYPGTVETLLLHNPFYLPIKTQRFMSDYTYQLLEFSLFTMDHLKSAAEFLRDSSQSSSRPTYKLGLTVPYVTCLNSIVQTPNFTEILQNVDIIVPSIYYHKHEGLTAIEEHDMIKNTYAQCEKNIQQVKTLEIIPLVSCKPTVSGDHSDVSEFLDCWEQMSDWANENERQVIMYEAFDRMDRFHVHHKGWWRLRNENVSWVDASSFVATPDDKFQISLNTEATFDRWIAVFFDHRVRYYPHFTSYSKQELQQMLGLVSTRFSTIVTGIKPYINSSSSSENITWTATMAARLNRENEFNPSFQPLQVIHTIYPEMTNLRDWLLYDTDLKQDVNLEQPLEVAQEANAIFPGTVTTIVFHKADSGFGWNGFKKALKTQLGNTNNSNAIRFGTYVDLSKCEVLKADFKSVSKWLKVVIIELASDFRSPIPWLQIANQNTAAYMDSALRNLFGKWEECRDSFHEVYPEVEIALAVDCSKVMRTHENTTIEQLAKCWEMITDYAEDNNVWVVLYQAFDTPYPLKAPLGERYVHDYTKGWWKLQQKSEVNITVDCFEEQFKDLVSDSVNSNKSIYRTARLGTKCEACGRRNVSMIVAIVILSVFCICLIMAVVYLYNGNIFRRLGQRDHVKFQVLSEDVTF